MSEIRSVSLGQDNYPKARPVRSSAPVARVSTTAAQVSAQPTASRDSFQSGHHDAQADQLNELRRRANGRPQAARTAPIEVDLGYPQATAKPGHRRAASNSNSSSASTSAPTRAQQPPTRSAPIEVNLGYPQAASNPGHGRVPTQAAPRNTNFAHSTVDANKVYADAHAVIAQKNRMNDAAHKGLGLEAKPQAPAQAKPQTPAKAQAPAKSKPHAPAQAKPQVKKTPTSKGGNMSGAGGVFTAAAGGLTLRDGVTNVKNGNYTQGGLQIAQGGLMTADGVNDVNLAWNGASGAPVSKGAARLKVAGGLMNAGMAANDTYQAYQAYKSGNEVAAAESTSSAVINAVTACPLTAPIGAIGGILDWGMAASGADDAMVRALTRGENAAYKKQLDRDMALANTLADTSSRDLAGYSRAQRQACIRGLDGLKEYRRYFASVGNTEGVKSADAQIARIKTAWSH